MALIEVEHPRRLATAAEAEALYCGLRKNTVSVTGFGTRDPELIRAVVAAIDTGREHTVSFDDGSLAGAAGRSLAALATGAYGYLDVRTPGSSFRSWPASTTWVDHDGAERIETTDVAAALAAFDHRIDDRLVNGFIKDAGAGLRPALERFLLDSGAEVRGTLYLSPNAARQLSERFSGARLQWQAPPVLVELPAGRIFGLLISKPSAERDRDRWLRAIDKALRRAGLGS